MALQQPNGIAVWTDSKEVAGEIIGYSLVDHGTHYSADPTSTPDARLLDDGNGAYETVESPDNPDDLPELSLISVVGSAIITVE